MEKEIGDKKQKYDIQKFGLTGGIFTALMFFIVTISSKFFGVFGSLVNTLLDIYGNIGYDLTLFGIILSIVYGFVTGYILWTIYANIHYMLPKKY